MEKRCNETDFDPTWNEIRYVEHRMFVRHLPFHSSASGNKVSIGRARDREREVRPLSIADTPPLSDKALLDEDFERMKGDGVPDGGWASGENGSREGKCAWPMNGGHD